MKLIYDNDREIFNLNTDGIPYLSFKTFDELGIPNLYSTRYESFETGSGEGIKGFRTAVMKTESAEEAGPIVKANRDRLARQLGSSLEFECITDQKHTNYVYAATEADLGSSLLSGKPLHKQFVDGVVTDVPGMLLTVFGGDCPSVYLADPVRKAIGLVHAGWKGTFGKIPEVAIANMVVRYGCNPKDMYAAIGPGICKDCYEMGDEIYEQFASAWGKADADRILSKYPAKKADGSDIPGGKYHLDLREANRMTLVRAGIPEDHISVSNVCTKCNVDTFYSYRARRMENEQVAMLVNRCGGAL